MDNIELALLIVYSNSEYRLDSRIFAKRMGYDDTKIVHQAIRRHKDALEKKSILLQFEAKPPKGSSGGRPETYYMLDRRQCLLLIGYLKKDEEEAAEFRELLIDAFLAAAKRIEELENQQATQTAEQIFTKDVQRRCMLNEKLLPSGYWCVVTEMWREAWTLEAFQKALKPSSLPDGSCGKKWKNHLKSINHPLLPKSKKACLHIPNLKNRVEVNIYPDGLLIDFRNWLRVEYADYYTHEYSPSRIKDAKEIETPKKKRLK